MSHTESHLKPHVKPHVKPHLKPHVIRDSVGCTLVDSDGKWCAFRIAVPIHFPIHFAIPCSFIPAHFVLAHFFPDLCIPISLALTFGNLGSLGLPDFRARTRRGNRRAPGADRWPGP